MNELPSDSEPQDKIPQTDKSAIDCLAQRALTFLLLVGGMSAVAVTLIPTSISGATRTARLEWERRKAEINLVVSPTAPSAHLPQ